MLEKKEKAKYIYEEFKFLFKSQTDYLLYIASKEELAMFKLFVGTVKEERHLKNFAKEYFKFRNFIIFTRNDLIDLKKSDDYKKEKFLNKIRINKEIKKYQKLCNNVCKFEELFYEEMGFSILKVENERWVEEKKQKEQSTVRYLN